MRFSFYDWLSKRLEMFRSFTGLDIAEFDSLLSRIELAYDDEHEKKGVARRDRKHEIGAGCQFKLALEDSLLTLLIYCRTHHQVHPSKIHLRPRPEQCPKGHQDARAARHGVHPLPEKFHELARRARTFEEVERYFPGFKP
jgi:hypothetical protein